MELWYHEPIDTRAKAGGETGVNGKEYKAGEFMPFYVPRSEMPQVRESDYPELFKLAERKGIKISFATVSPDMLKKHQRIDEANLKHEIKTEGEAEEVLHEITPVLASKDFFILDGNHRVDDHRIKGTNVPTVFIGLDFEEAIAFLFSFSKTSISTDLK